MPQPTAGDVHVNRPLTSISIAFMQDASNFVASRVFPNIPVQKQSDRYFTYNRADFWRDEARERAPGTESAGSGYNIDSTPNYFADVVAFHKDVPDQIRANADSPLAPDREATEFVTTKLMINREKRWASSYFTTGLWTTDAVGAATPTASQVLHWSDAASTPIENVRTAKRTVHSTTGYMPNKLVLSGPVYDALVDHPDIVDRVKYGQTPGSPATVNKMALAALFEVDEVVVAQAIEATAKEGAADAFDYITGKNALLCYSNPSPGIMTPSAGYTFSWTGWMGAGTEGNRIKRFRMENLEADRVEGQMAFDTKLVSADLGYFFSTIVA